MPIRRQIKRAALGAAASLALLAPTAQAGQYMVYSCKTPLGDVAPIDGWASEQVGGAFSSPANGCASGGALVAQLSGEHQQAVGDRVTWRWTAPANTQIQSLDMWRSMSVTSGPDVNGTPMSYMSWPSADFGADAPQHCVAAWGCGTLGAHGAWDSSANVTWISPNQLNGTNVLHVTAACGGTQGYRCEDRNSATPMSDIRMHAMRVWLQDATDPAPGVASGTLTQPGVHKGIASVSFDATDTGSGIYRGIVEVRRQGEASYAPVANTVVDTNGGRCVDAGADPGSIHEFLHRVPCKLSASADLDVDTRLVADGVHEVRVRVEDASGNRATAYGPARLEVDNVPPPAALSRPAIIGGARVGNTLVGDKGSWSGANNAYGTRWLRCVSPTDEGTCTPIAGAGGPELELGDADLGYFIRYEVKATNAEGSTTALSPAKGRITSTAGDVPACADGVDNDGDGKVDDADAGCSGRGDGTEDAENPLPAPTPTATPATPAPVSVDRPGAVLGTPSNGANASNRARITLSGTRRRAVRFGRAIATVATLRDETGRPIAGARVAVLERMNTPGADWVPAREPLVTDGEGKLRWLIPAKFSRTIRYAYKANLANTEFQSTSDVVLSVSSKTSMKASRSFLRNGQTVRFSGRVVSKPIPRGGVLIDLQAKVGSRWQTFRTARTKMTGNWRSAYTFRATRGLQTYSFRARVRQDSAFPYAMSTSRVIRVRVAG